MKEFKNKVAAITGSATGIGRAFAEEAAKRGMRLALIDINTEGLEETKAICEKAGAPKVVTIKTDVTKYEEVRFSILRVMQEYGQLDLMFANAGIATAGWVYNHPPQDWAWAMNTNVLGLTYYVHAHLQAAGHALPLPVHRIHRRPDHRPALQYGLPCEQACRRLHR